MKIIPKSFHLQWSITERCNLNCRHCYRDKELIEKELKKEETIKILENFISQIKKWNLDPRGVRISYTGGEPFVKEGLFDLLKKSKENHDKFSYGILTNGLAINKKMIKKLKKLEVDYVQLSLEGMEENNNYIRGEGMFEKIIEAGKLIRDNNIKVNFSMTVSEVNLDDVPEVIKLSEKLKIPLALRRLVPIGAGEELKNSLLTPQEVKDLWNYISRVKNNFWDGVSIGCEDGMLVQDFPQYNPGDCSAGYASFTVLPNGDVYPCRRLPIKVGNLVNESFEEIYRAEPMQKLRNINNVNDVCFECPHFKKCKGGAKCVSYAYFNNFKAPDPQCWRLFNKLPEKNLKWRNNSEERNEKLDPRWYKSKRKEIVANNNTSLSKLDIGKGKINPKEKEITTEVFIGKIFKNITKDTIFRTFNYTEETDLIIIDLDKEEIKKDKKIEDISDWNSGMIILDQEIDQEFLEQDMKLVINEIRLVVGGKSLTEKEAKNKFNKIKNNFKNEKRER